MPQLPLTHAAFASAVGQVHPVLLRQKEYDAPPLPLEDGLPELPELSELPELPEVLVHGVARGAMPSPSGPSASRLDGGAGAPLELLDVDSDVSGQVDDVELVEPVLSLPEQPQRRPDATRPTTENTERESFIMRVILGCSRPKRTRSGSPERARSRIAHEHKDYDLM